MCALPLSPIRWVLNNCNVYIQSCKFIFLYKRVITQNISIRGTPFLCMLGTVLLSHTQKHEKQYMRIPCIHVSTYARVEYVC